MRIAGWSGLSDDYVQKVNSDRPIPLDSTSPSSRAFHTGTAVAVRDVTAEPEFALWAGIARGTGLPAVIAVTPDRPQRSTGHPQRLLRTGAHLHRARCAANDVAGQPRCDRADLCASRLDELRALNISLLEQRDMLRRSEQIHQRLLGVTLRSGGLDGIAGTLRDLLGRPVLIDDARHGVLARRQRRLPRRRLARRSKPMTTTLRRR